MQSRELEFFSQQGEDIFIYKHLINQERIDGTFVEIGGYNGVTYSNTLFFENTLKFTGTLIEPTKQFEYMKMNRPNCHCYNLAVGYSNEPLLFIGDDACAGAVDEMYPEHKKLNSPTEYYVNAMPFGEILEKSSLPYIDLMTIDVEGGELMVLETMNWNIPTYIICIECHERGEIEKIKNEKCRQLLLSKGFIFYNKFCGNEFWVNLNYPRKHLLFNDTIKSNLFENTNITFRYLAKHCLEETIDNVI